MTERWARWLAAALGGPVSGVLRLPSASPGLTGPLDGHDLAGLALSAREDAVIFLSGTCAAARIETVWEEVSTGHGQRYDLAMKVSTLHRRNPLHDDAPGRVLHAALGFFEDRGRDWLRALGRALPPLAMGSGLERLSVAWCLDLDEPDPGDHVPLAVWPTHAWPAARRIGSIPVVRVGGRADEDDEEDDGEKEEESDEEPAEQVRESAD